MSLIPKYLLIHATFMVLILIGHWLAIPLLGDIGLAGTLTTTAAGLFEGIQSMLLSVKEQATVCLRHSGGKFNVVSYTDKNGRRCWLMECPTCMEQYIKEIDKGVRFVTAEDNERIHAYFEKHPEWKRAVKLNIRP